MPRNKSKLRTIHARYIYIEQYRMSHYLDVGIVDDAFNCTITPLSMSRFTSSLSQYMLDRLTTIFRDWRIDLNTIICFSPSIPKTNPLRIFAKILFQYVDVDLCFADRDVIMHRIVYNAPSVVGKVKRKHMKQLREQKTTIRVLKKDKATFSTSDMTGAWKQLIHLGKCPWISLEVDDKLHMMSSNMRMRQIVTRMGLFYLALREFYKAKRKLYLKPQVDNLKIPEYRNDVHIDDFYAPHNDQPLTSQ